MAWLDFLKKKKEGIEEPDYIDYSELPQYIKKINQPKISEIKRLFEELQRRLYGLEESLIELKNAKIQEPNPKIVNVILGNRESYIQHTKNFIDSISIPEEITFSRTKQFCTQFERNLAEFAGRSTKAYEVTRNLIGEELAQTAKKIKDIEEYVKEIKLFLEEENVGGIIELDKKTHDFLNTITIKRTNNMEIDSLKKQIAQFEFEQSKILEEINSLSATKDFSKLNSLKEQNNEIQKNIDNLTFSINEKFSGIDKALRKFNKMSENELINDYLENPLKSLQRDKELKILSILKNIEASLIDEQLEIKDDKKEKILETIKEINELYLNNLLKEYNSLNQEQIRIKNSLLINKTEEKISMLNSKLNNMSTKKNSVQKKLNGIEEKNKINIDDISKNLSDKIKTITTRQVVIQTKDI